MPPPRLRLPPLHPYRLFHLSARLRLRDRPAHALPDDDYYALLLSQPIPTPATQTITPASNPTTSSPATLPPTAAQTTQSPPASFQGSDRGPDNRVLFSTPLAGPSARMRGLERGERGEKRPAEPDNCCMSGCVNCVWDAYREEVEEWAAARRRRDGEETRRGVGIGGGGGVRGLVGLGDGEDGGGVGDLDGVGGLGGMDDEGLFEGVPVGIREFMNTEKRLRERRGKEHVG